VNCEISCEFFEKGVGGEKIADFAVILSILFAKILFFNGNNLLTRLLL